MSDRCRLLTIYLGLFLNVSLHGATYFVTQHHPQASDENPGTVDRPWKTISKAVTTIAPGAVVIIGDGVYRESIIVKSGGTAQSPIRFESASGAHVVLTGADQLFGWKKSDERRPVYEISWTHRFNTWSKNMTHPDDDYHRVIGRCEQVAIQNYLLHQVLERDQLSPGSFFADIANQKLVVWDIAGRDLNRGNGLWLDIGNENCAVKQCLIADNEDSGIFYEISYGLHAYDNVIMGNGFAATPGAWGAQAGISLSSSPDCVIERNLISGNREGFNFREQHRATPRIDDPKERAVWNHNEEIRRNIIACNRDAQVWGWFDLKDGRQWPAEEGRGRSNSAESIAARHDDLAAAYVASNAQRQPTGLTLEKLRLHFDDNLYFADAGHGWFEWGVTWGRHQTYNTLQDFRTCLGLDKEGQVADPEFANPSQPDFRLRPEQMAKLKSYYPRGQIPGVLLGLR